MIKNTLRNFAVKLTQDQAKHGFKTLEAAIKTSGTYVFKPEDKDVIQ
jgi:hypothetical protein